MSKGVRFIGLILAVSVLIIIAAVIYKRYQPNSSQQSKTSIPQSLPDNKVATNSGVIRLKPGELPKLNASPSAVQLNSYIATVQTNAQATGLIKVTACKADPAVFKVKKGSTFTIQNNDNKDIQLNVAAGAIYKVSANRTQSFTMSVGPAIFKFSCEYSTGGGNPESGVVEVTS